MDRPRASWESRGSGRPSKRVTDQPREASMAAQRVPTRPPPTTAALEGAEVDMMVKGEGVRASPIEEKGPRR